MKEHVISMETNTGETSEGHDPSIVHTEATQNQSIILYNEENEEISNERQERNEHRADWKSKAITYLRSKLDNDDQLINKDKSQDVPCPKVPPKLRNNKRSKDYYDPKIVSFGPYHHNNVEVQPAQMIKTRVMQNFILEHGKSIEELYIKVHELNDHAKSCYVDDAVRDYDGEGFAMMMLQDGCFILFLIECKTYALQNNKELLTSWKMDNSLTILDHLGAFEVQYLYQDMILLENQIPFKVLNVLMSNIYEENEGLTMIKSYLYGIHKWGKFLKEDSRDEDEENPPHLLGLLKTLISKGGDHVETMPKTVDMDMTSYLQSFGSVSDLQAKGINFKPSNSIFLHSAKKEKPKSISLRDVEFKSGLFTGELKLPPLILDSNSQAYYTNLIAFEMCAPTDFTVASYINFMNSLIANPEDVKALRSKRIILDTRNSDEEVFKTLKEISVTKYRYDFSVYQDVRQDIENHYNNNIKIWIAQIRHKYFSQPWSAIGLLAAVVVLILSFLQTFYTIYPRKG